MSAYVEDIDEMVSQMEEGIPLSPTHRRMAALEAGASALRVQDEITQETITGSTVSDQNAVRSRAYGYDSEAFQALQEENIRFRQALSNARSELGRRTEIIDGLRVQLEAVQSDIEEAVERMEEVLRK